MRTMVTCDVRDGRRALYVPPDMAELQPRSLRYLHTFARQHDLQLVENRRRVVIRPMNEKRARTSKGIAKATGELLQQLGMPGQIRQQSKPHRLSSDSPHIGIEKLIRMAAFAAPQAKQSFVTPNSTLINLLGDHNDPIKAYGCKLISEDTNTVLSHFESPHFRGIGYTAGQQYVMHVCMGGGPADNPDLWASFHTMTRSDFRFHLFNCADGQPDVGLFYATVYLDLGESPAPWWLSTWADTRASSVQQDQPFDDFLEFRHAG